MQGSEPTFSLEGLHSVNFGPWLQILD